MSFKEIAHQRWHQILMDLGATEELLSGKHQPCPKCGGKDRFRYTDYKGHGNYFCSVCGPGDGVMLAMALTGMGFADLAKRIEKMSEHVERKPKVKPDYKRRLNAILKESTYIQGPVQDYLLRRGFVRWHNLRMHPRLAYYEGRELIAHFPAMLGIVMDLSTGRKHTFHVTYVDNGQKADVPSPKKILPCEENIAGCVVAPLGIPDQAKEIGVAEGIESAMSAQRLTGIPTVASISAIGMERLRLPKSVETVHVFGDNDDTFTGQASAYNLARRLVLKDKIQAKIHIPEIDGYDWNDVQTDDDGRGAAAPPHP